MKKETTKIKVIDVQTGQTLFECSLNESEKAYAFAAQMDEMGLDIKVVAPTLNETLSESLGLSREQQAAYQKSLDDELEHHDGVGSCCFEENDPNKILN